MALPTASDNVWPKLIVSEQTTPATPASGKQTVFIDSADHKVKRVNSSGTVTTVEGGGSGNVATDTIWDAAGDLAVGTGADTAAKLTLGASGKVLASNGSTAVWALPPGYEIGYDQITANVTVTSTTESSGTTIITASAYTFDGSPVIAEFFAPLIESDSTTATDTLLLSLFESTTEVGIIAQVRTTVTGGSRVQVPCCARYRFTPSAGSHTYKVTGFSTANNGATVVAGTPGTGTFVPAFLRFTKV